MKIQKKKKNRTKQIIKFNDQLTKCERMKFNLNKKIKDKKMKTLCESMVFSLTNHGETLRYYMFFNN